MKTLIKTLAIAIITLASASTGLTADDKEMMKDCVMRRQHFKPCFSW